MAVVMYTGTPGSGKSYHAAEVVDRALRRKIPVIANFQVNLNPKKHKGEFVYIPTLEMTVDKFKQYAQEHFDSSKRDEHQGVIIIDEAQIPFNSRDGLNKDRMKWIEFFSQHRHYFYDIILITQNDRMIDRLGVENALYTLYKVDEHLSILLTRKGSRNRQITRFISQRCIISIAKQICFVNTTYGSKT